MRAKQWLALAIGVTILAMGTHVRVADVNLWCPLPFFVFRLIPVLGNVRVPERWMAVGAIAWSTVLALALVKLAQTRGVGRLRKAAAIATALVLFENWPAIPFISPLPPSTVYEQLRQLPAGAVLPLPLYMGDSSIGVGDAVQYGATRFSVGSSGGTDDARKTHRGRLRGTDLTADH